MAVTCPQVNSKVFRDVGTTVIWHLPDWGKDHDFQALKSKACCIVDVGSGSFPLNQGPRARLRFSFSEDYQSTSTQRGTDGQETRVDTYWISLNMTQLVNLDQQIFQYEVTVESLHDKLEVSGGRKESTVNQTMPYLSSRYYWTERVVQHEFLKVRQTRWQKRRRGESIARHLARNPTNVVFPRPSELRLKITITPSYVSNAIVPPIIGGQPQPSYYGMGYMGQAVKNMLGAVGRLLDPVWRRFGIRRQ